MRAVEKPASRRRPTQDVERWASAARSGVGSGPSAGWCAELAELIWPAACPGCGATGAGTVPACAACLSAFGAPPVPTAPTPRPAWLPALWAVAHYDGSARAVMLAYKERGSRRLARPIGGALAAALMAALQAASARPTQGRCAVVPMPSSAAARRTRGEDPTLRMARLAVARLRVGGVPAALVPALEQHRGVRDQAGLSATDRMRNLSGALRVRPAAQPLLAAATTVMLADDIVTTGATLAEATRVLLPVGFAVAGAAVVAATQRRPAGPAGGAGAADRGETGGGGIEATDR